MRHIGHIMVAAYSAAVLLLQYFPAMATSTGIKESGPWIIAMIIAFLFALSAAFKLLRGVIESWSNDDVSLSEFDISDTTVFGLFTVFIGVNLVAHGVLAALADTAGSLWFGMWVLADIVVGLVSFVVFKVTAKAQLQQSSRPRSVGRHDAA